MGKFVKRQELEAADSPYKIAKLNVSHAASHLAPSDIDIGICSKGNCIQSTEREEGQPIAGFRILEKSVKLCYKQLSLRYKKGVL